MAIWTDIGRGGMNLGHLWQQLDQDTRLSAASAFYRHEIDDGGALHARADARVAAALKFRAAAVRKLPVERRARSLAFSTRLDLDLVSAMLTALHFEDRSEIMVAFLDALGIQHEAGLIAPDHGVLVTDADRLTTAIEGLYSGFPAEQVDLYLATLYLSDPDSWKMIEPVMRSRKPA